MYCIVGQLNFKQFVIGASLMCSGDLGDKLEVSFEVYDIDDNGQVSKEEMVEILTQLNKTGGYKSGCCDLIWLNLLSAVPLIFA